MTMNLADNGDGMVPLMNNNQATTFRQNESSAYIQHEKNINEHKETTMDSTPINDIMMEPRWCSTNPRCRAPCRT